MLGNSCEISVNWVLLKDETGAVPISYEAVTTVVVDPLGLGLALYVVPMPSSVGTTKAK